MVTFKTFQIKVDTKLEYESEKIVVSQMDLNSAEIVVAIMQDNKPLPLQGVNVKAAFKKPDNTHVFQDQKVEVVDPNAGLISIVLTTQTVAAVGIVLGEIHIEDSEKRIVTRKFKLHVEESYIAKSVESKNELGIVDKLIEAGEQLQGVDIPTLVKAGEVVTEVQTSVEKRGLDLLSFGAKGDGSNDILAFEKMFAKTDKIKTVYVPDGIYGISKPLVVPPKIRMIFAPNAVLKPLSDINLLQMKPEAYVEGVTIDLRGLPFPYTKAAIYFDATDIFQFYEQTHMLKDVNILGERKHSGWTGTGILMEAKTPMSYIDNVKCNNITITNMQKGIHLRVDPKITKEADMAWVNANFFHQVTIMNVEYGLYLEGDSKVPRDVGGNLFDQVQFQAEAGTKRLIYCEGGTNRFNVFGWDIHKIDPKEAAYEFTKSARFNQIVSPMAQEITEGWIDKGYLNSFVSPNNYTAEKRINAMPISLPTKPNFLGNQDDYLVNGHKRGYTVTKVSMHPLVSGELTDILTFDTESGITLDGTNATYENPIIIEIDTSSDPIWYAAFLTVMSSWESQPQNYEMELFDDLSNSWIGVHWTKNNRSQSIAVSAPWAAVDKCMKIRIKCWGSNLANNQIGISRVMMTSTKDGGKAFLPYTDYTKTPPETNITPLLPNDKKMVGDQDDVLLLADKRFKVNIPGAPKTGGNVWSIFSLRREQFCRWTDPTITAPIIIEIDFGTTPLKYLESVGISFGWDETPKNIKIERVTAQNGAYAQIVNVTNNTAATIHVAARTANTYKLRFTIYGVNNANKLIRINRIFATTGDEYPKTFVNTESDNTVFGDLLFGNSDKSVVLKSPNGSLWKLVIDDTGVLAIAPYIKPTV
ncbi:BppU family phage baseplate upper protein [Bacillus cereus]|uniref:BppU family phage baseplate upper protein n=1 Tax=Bacillus cereus TaxID=1396 RepID=UPI00382077B8